MDLDELIINTAVFLTNQKRRCLNAGTCAYAAPDGNHCAVGANMPQEMAEDLDTLEMGGWDSIVYTARADDRYADQCGADYQERFAEKQHVCRAAVAHFAGIPDGLISGLQSTHDAEKDRDRSGRMRMLCRIDGYACAYGASDSTREALGLLMAKVESE